jgi:hypothetical protein
MSQQPIDKNLLRGEYDTLRERVNDALDYLDREARNVSRHSLTGEILETIGCHLTGRKGGWQPGNR